MPALTHPKSCGPPRPNRHLKRVRVLAVLVLLLGGPGLVLHLRGERDRAHDPQTLLHAQALPADPHSVRLLQQFGQLALSSEFGGRHRKDRIVRWQTGGPPIGVWILGSRAGEAAGGIFRHLALLSRLTGLRFRHRSDSVPEGTGRGIRIRLLDPGVLARYGLGSDCSVELFARGDRIERAEIVLPTAPPFLRDHCIAEELTQAMGLLNDSNLLADSVFHDRSRLLGLSPIDRLMVRLLYDPEVQPGMEADRALAAAGRRMAGMRRRLLNPVPDATP